MKTKYDFPKIGCYFDGANGQDYNDLRLLKLALGYGWEDKEAEEIVASLQDEDEDLDDEIRLHHREIICDVTQEAEEFLNSLETRPFLYWGWNDGNFGLWPNVEGAKEDVGFISVKSLAAARNLGIETDPEDSERPPADYRGEWLHVNDHGNCTLYVREDAIPNTTNGAVIDREIWSVV